MTKTEAAKILARQGNRMGIRRHDSVNGVYRRLSTLISELTHTSAPDSLIRQAIDAEPALTTIRRYL